MSQQGPDKPGTSPGPERHDPEPPHRERPPIGDPANRPQDPPLPDGDPTQPEPSRPVRPGTDPVRRHRPDVGSRGGSAER